MAKTLAIIPLMRTKLQRPASGVARIDPLEAEFDVLPPIPLLEPLGHASFQRLFERASTRPFKAGEVIFRQGDAGDTLYVITAGTVDVIAEEFPRVHLARLGEGSFFGEIALFTDRPRGATVEAVSSGTLLCLDRATTSALIQEAPQVQAMLLHFFRGRLASTILATSGMFHALSTEDKAALTARFSLHDLAAQVRLIEEGRPSDALYMVVEGRLQVLRKGEELAVLTPGRLCGEISMVTQSGAVADVVAQCPSVVLRLSREDFLSLSSNHPELMRYLAQLASERMEKVTLL